MGSTAKSFVQGGLEASYTPGGALPTAVAAKKMFPVVGSTFELKRVWDLPDEQRNSYSKYFQSLVPLTRTVDWNMKGRWYPDNNLGLMTLVTGSSPGIVNTAASAPEPSYYTWTFSPQDTILSMTLEEFDGTQSWQHANCFATKAEFDFNAEADLTYTFSGFGLDRTQHAMTGSITQPSDPTHTGASCQVFIDDAGGTMGATSFADVMSGKITIDLAAKPVWTGNNAQTFGRWYRGKRVVTLDLDVDFSASNALTEYSSKFLASAGVYRYVSVVFNGQLLPGGAGGAVKTYKLSFNVPVRYQSFVTDKTKEHTTAKIMGVNYYDPTLAYEYQVVSQVGSTSSALSAY